MPRIAKGGKYVFGWSKVGKRGRIVISPEAMEEYGFREGDRVLLMSGSRTSGGFCVSLPPLLVKSAFASALPPALVRFRVPRGEVLQDGRQAFCWTEIERGGSITLPEETLKAYGTVPGGRLLSVRGSYLGLGFLARGPLIEEALRHPELASY